MLNRTRTSRYRRARMFGRLTLILGLIAVVVTQWVVTLHTPVVSQCAMQGCQCGGHESGGCCCHQSSGAESTAEAVLKSVTCGTAAPTVVLGGAKYDFCLTVVPAELPVLLLESVSPVALSQSDWDDIPPVPPPRLLGA